MSLHDDNTGNPRLTRPDRYPDLPGQGPPQAIHRKPRSIKWGWLRSLNLAERPAYSREATGADALTSLKNTKAKPISLLESTLARKAKPRTKPF